MSTAKVKIAPSQQIMRNRTYNCQMRNLYYEKAYYQFRKLKSSIDLKNASGEYETLSELYELAELLNVCLSYARASISNNKFDKITTYAQDHYWGILQEEILLTYFLEEQILSVKYITSLIETNIRVQAFINKTESEISVSHIINNINELNKDTEKDLDYFYENIKKRYAIGNKLFSILQELQRFQ